MELVGAVASILSIVKATKTVCSWIAHLIHISEHIRQLHSELFSFEILVQGLQKAMTDETLTTAILHEHVEAVLTEAKCTLNSLKATLMRAKKDGAWNHTKLRLALNESSCKELSQKIHRHAAALTWIMIVVINSQGLVSPSPF